MEKHVTAMFKKETELIGWLDVIKLKGLAAQDWIESTSAQLSPQNCKTTVTGGFSLSRNMFGHNA